MAHGVQDDPGKHRTYYFDLQQDLLLDVAHGVQGDPACPHQRRDSSNGAVVRNGAAVTHASRMVLLHVVRSSGY